MSQEAFDVAAAASGAKATYGGAGTTVLGWWLSSEAAVLMGIVIGVSGLLVQWYYSHRRDQREEARHQREMERKRDTV